MKSTILMRHTVTALFAVLAIPAQIIAQDQQDHKREHLPHYRVKDLGTLGGTSSYATHITNNGLISGHSSPADGTWHAILWYKERIKDLGTLGGQNSVTWSVNERGHAVGEAETSEPDANGEDFCGFQPLGLPSSGNTCLPFLWRHGVMTQLATLPGGNNGSANTINSRGEVAGFAENSTRDRTCPAFDPAKGQYQKFQFKPVIWPNGKIHELPTFRGDPDGIALGINDNGQIVGASGSCAPFNPALQIYLNPKHALLWQNGTVIDLGNLGGEFGNIAFSVNKQGQVVGNSDLRGDQYSHAFLWTKATGMKDLRPFFGDVISGALGINDQGEVVGVSLDANFNLRAMLWENRVPIDLNNLVIDNDSGLYLQLAESINSRGEIVGFGMVKGTTDTHAYLAIPCDRDHGDR
jgi:probable HAF family extracellular repeat protein